MYICATSIHVARGRKTLQTYGFPMQIYGKHSRCHNFNSKAWIKILLRQTSSFNSFCVLIYKWWPQVLPGVLWITLLNSFFFSYLVCNLLPLGKHMHCLRATHTQGSILACLYSWASSDDVSVKSNQVQMCVYCHVIMCHSIHERITLPYMF